MSSHADHREQDVRRDRCRRHRVGPAHVAGRRRAGLGCRLRRSGHARRPRREPGGCRHRHGHPDRAGRFSPAGTRDLDPHDLGADQRCAADRRGDDGATRRAGEAVGSGDRRAGRPVHRPGGSGCRHRDPGSSGADDAAAAPGGGASARRACRTLSRSQADADRRGAPVQRRCAGWRGGGRRGRADPAGAVRPGGRDPADRGSGASRHRQVPDRGHGRSRGLGAEGRYGRRQPARSRR